MNRFFLLVLVFLLACRKEKKEPAVSEEFIKLQAHMWQQDSIVFFENGRREVAIPPTLHAQFVKATSTELQYFFGHNLEAPSLLETNRVRYQKPNKLEIWHPGITGGPPSYKIEIDNINDTHLRYSYFSSPDYIKSREYYYHVY